MTVLLIIGVLPSIAFMVALLYAVIDAEHINADTKALIERWDQNERDA